jgi:hypothetical protein
MENFSVFSGNKTLDKAPSNGKKNKKNKTYNRLMER